jgi:hypothetical protein
MSIGAFATGCMLSLALVANGNEAVMPQITGIKVQLSTSRNRVVKGGVKVDHCGGAKGNHQ